MKYKNHYKKTYLNIPYAKKDEAWFAGAKWDKEKKKWFYFLAGEEEPDSGTVVFRKDIKVGLLMQEVHFEPGLTILDAVFSSDSELFRVVKNYELAVLDEDHEKLAELFDSMERKVRKYYLYLTLGYLRRFCL